MKKNIDFSVIIVNYCSHEVLREALSTFTNAHVHCPYSYEFIVVDSASGPAEVAALEHMLTSLDLGAPLKWRALETNRGFGSANNSAATDASGRFLLFLNPDTLCHQDILSSLAPVLDDDHTGAVAPVLRLPDGRLQPDSFGAFPTPTSIIAHKLHPIQGEPDIAPRQSVNWVSGACLSVSAAHFRAVWGFDSHYFMYYEDVDLCHRLATAGYHNYVVGTASIIHLGGDRPRLTRARRRAYFVSQDRYLHLYARPNLTFFLARALYRFICYFKDARD